MPDLIEKWKHQKQTKNASQTQYLKKLKNSKNKNIDVLAEKLHNQVFSEIDCLKCANCCTSIPPIIIKSDIKRIAKHLNLTEKQFAEKHLTTDEDGDQVLNASPCKFLLPDNKCSIYDVRPKACRAYPHTNHYEFSRHLFTHIQNTMYCPAVFNIVDLMMKKIKLPH